MLIVTRTGGRQPGLMLIIGGLVLAVCLYLPPIEPVAVFSGPHQYGWLRWLRFYPLILLALVIQEGGAS